MNLRTETFVIKSDPELTIIVKEVSLGEGLARLEKFDELRQMHKDMTSSEREILVRAYVNILTATQTVEGMDWPLEYDDFLGLPQWIVDIWLNEVITLNPTWGYADAEVEKKIQRKHTKE